MTPQLQQAIKLLQLSTVELQTEINEIINANPLLEMEDFDLGETKFVQSKTENGSNDTHSAPENVERIAPIDDNYWDNSYSQASATPKRKNNDTLLGDRDIPNPTDNNLHEHLLWQLNLTPMSPTDNAIATAVIDAVSDDGYLRESLDTLQSILTPYYEIELDEIEAVLHRIQHFDPIGVAARNLRECLLTQINQIDPRCPGFKSAKQLIDLHLDTLGKGNLDSLKRTLNIDQSEITEAITLIRSLDPKPGSQIADNATEYVAPDVYVIKDGDDWKISLNPSSIPKLKIQDYYAGLIKNSTKDDASYIRSQLQEARWFIKSLETRNETLVKVAECILERQKGFFEHGPEAMQPLVLRDVAETIDMHESTISRATTRKYLHCPSGVFEFKYFFSSHVSTADGGECSATAIQAMIKNMIHKEIPNKPLSDSKIAKSLNDKGIGVARRTIAKYREALHIPSSTDRKRLA